MNKLCDYYFAPQSPWAYLGHARLVEIAKRQGAQIALKPCDLSRVFHASGGLPLSQRPPQRQAYRLTELKRWSEHLNIALNLQPTFFPVSGDAAARLIIATRLTHGSEAALQISGAIMQALWAEQQNIADPDTLASIAFDCDLEGKDLLKSADTASVQSEYDQYTDDAITANVFGSPWYVVNGEGYWGQDRLDFVERALAKG